MSDDVYVQHDYWETCRVCGKEMEIEAMNGDCPGPPAPPMPQTLFAIPTSGCYECEGGWYRIFTTEAAARAHILEQPYIMSVIEVLEEEDGEYRLLREIDVERPAARIVAILNGETP